MWKGKGRREPRRVGIPTQADRVSVIGMAPGGRSTSGVSRYGSPNSRCSSRRQRKNSNTALKVVLAAVLGVVLLVGGCAVVAVVASDSTGYNEETRTTFVDTCTKDAGGTSRARSVCACFYRWFKDNVPYERFEELDRAEPDDSRPPEFGRARRACD